MRETRLLILGLGNVLCGDDGVGPAAAELLHAQYILPDAVVCLDGGTLGLALVPYIEDAPRAILMDAIAADAPAGTLVRLEGAQVTAAARKRLSCHQLGVADLLEVALLCGGARERLILLGIVPGSVDLGAPRTPAVEAALPALVAAVVTEANGLGYTLIPRANRETSAG